MSVKDIYSSKYSPISTCGNGTRTKCSGWLGPEGVSQGIVASSPILSERDFWPGVWGAEGSSELEGCAGKRWRPARLETGGNGPLHLRRVKGIDIFVHHHHMLERAMPTEGGGDGPGRRHRAVACRSAPPRAARRRRRA